MPYEKTTDLPKTLQDTMPKGAQEIYIEAYNQAYEEYEEDRGGQAGQEAVAHRDAMHAVNEEYVHDSETGKWHRKGEAAEEKEKGKHGLLGKIREEIEELT